MSARDTETRDRLLQAGARLFADRGFRKVTVRDICRVARANVAAVLVWPGRDSRRRLPPHSCLLKSSVAAVIDTAEKIARNARSKVMASKPVFLSSRLLNACTA